MGFILQSVEGLVNLVVADAWSGLKLLAVFCAFFVISKWACGGYSRELWYEETTLKVRSAHREIGEQGQKFLQRRKAMRTLYRVLLLLFVLALPWTWGHILYGVDNFGPLLASGWFFFVIIAVFFAFIRALNSLLNLELLAREVRKQREASREEKSQQEG